MALELFMTQNFDLKLGCVQQRAILSKIMCCGTWCDQRDIPKCRMAGFPLCPPASEYLNSPHLTQSLRSSTISSLRLFQDPEDEFHEQFLGLSLTEKSRCSIPCFPLENGLLLLRSIPRTTTSGALRSLQKEPILHPLMLSSLLNSLDFTE